jgi:hypothetical protein
LKKIRKFGKIFQVFSNIRRVKMSFDPNVARPSASISNASIPISSDGTPLLYWELAIKKAERAQARAAEEAKKLARQLDRNPQIEAKRCHKVDGDGCS